MEAALVLVACPNFSSMPMGGYLDLGNVPWLWRLAMRGCLGIGRVPWPRLLAMRGKASVGPQSYSHVPRMPHGLHVAAVDHVGVLVASNAKHYVGLGPLASFANVPSEHHHFTPHNRRTCLRPSLPLG